MEFKPKTEKELAEASLWPDGEYPFEVIKAENKLSGPSSKKPGTPFIALKLKCWKGESSRVINGILHPSMERPIHEFCAEVGLGDRYEQGALDAADCEGLSGIVRLKITEAKGDFPAKNEPAGYGTKRKEKAAAAPKAEAGEADDVPF